MTVHLLDLHAHFPMHTPFPPAASTDPAIGFKKFLLDRANAWFNYEHGVPRMAPSRVAAGVFSGFASVLYDPEDEFLVRRSNPTPEGFAHVRAQAVNVEEEAASLGIAVAKDPGAVEQYLQSGERFLLHAAEGGFACGGDPANVARLADLGVAYLILAHLTYRNIATCANAIPHLPDALFGVLNPQRPWERLTPLGTRLAEEAIRQGVILDVTHCTDRAQQQIFEMASAFHPKVPVISSHNGVRGLAPYEVNLSDEALDRIADLAGVVGIIIYPHWLRAPGSRNDSLDLVVSAIEYVAARTRSYDYVAIGSDLDGFIQPVRECPNYSRIGVIEDCIRHRYAPEIADKILWRNALRVLQAGWRNPRH